MNELTLAGAPSAPATLQNIPSELLQYALQNTTVMSDIQEGAARTNRIRNRSAGLSVEPADMPQGAEPATLSYLDVIIVRAAPAVQRMYYAGQYEKDTPFTAPNCFSADGKVPHPNAAPEHRPLTDLGQPVTRCDLCPKNIKKPKGGYGSGAQKINSCGFSRTIAVIPLNDPEKRVFSFTVPAVSLFADPVTRVFHNEFGFHNDSTVKTLHSLKSLLAWFAAPSSVAPQGAPPFFFVTRILVDAQGDVYQKRFTVLRNTTIEEARYAISVAETPEVLGLINFMDSIHQNEGNVYQEQRDSAVPVTQAIDKPANVQTQRQLDQEIAQIATQVGAAAATSQPLPPAAPAPLPPPPASAAVPVQAPWEQARDSGLLPNNVVQWLRHPQVGGSDVADKYLQENFPQVMMQFTSPPPPVVPPAPTVQASVSPQTLSPPTGASAPVTSAATPPKPARGRKPKAEKESLPWDNAQSMAPPVEAPKTPALNVAPVTPAVTSAASSVAAVLGNDAIPDFDN